MYSLGCGTMRKVRESTRVTSPNRMRSFSYATLISSRFIPVLQSVAAAPGKPRPKFGRYLLEKPLPDSLNPSSVDDIAASLLKTTAG